MNWVPVISFFSFVCVDKVSKAIVEEFKSDGTVVRLNLDNYNQDNGGIEVDESVTIAPDLDKEAADRKEAVMKDKLKEIGVKYKEYFDKVAADSKPSAEEAKVEENPAV